MHRSGVDPPGAAYFAYRASTSPTTDTDLLIDAINEHPFRPDTRALDVGTGTGRAALALKAAGAAHVEAIDISRRAVLAYSAQLAAEPLAGAGAPRGSVGAHLRALRPDRGQPAVCSVRDGPAGPTQSGSGLGRGPRRPRGPGPAVRRYPSPPRRRRRSAVGAPPPCVIRRAPSTCCPRRDLRAEVHPGDGDPVRTGAAIACRMAAGARLALPGSTYRATGWLSAGGGMTEVAGAPVRVWVDPQGPIYLDGPGRIARRRRTGAHGDRAVPGGDLRVSTFGPLPAVRRKPSQQERNGSWPTRSRTRSSTRP